MARLDAELVRLGIARSRERAKEMIKNGSIKVGGCTAKKASTEVGAEDVIESSEQEMYVGRGAMKLEKAAECFGLEFSEKICLDIGASTGGFTEFMLKNGAKKVYAVDVGHGQLAASLRIDDRVVNMEGTDIRKTGTENFGGGVEFICADLSFISLRLVLPKMYELLKDGACAAVLIKPQFEAGKKHIGKNGVLSDRKTHERILTELDSAFAGAGFIAEKYTYSPVKGGSGNIEYLVKLVKTAGTPAVHNFGALVESAFVNL